MIDSITPDPTAARDRLRAAVIEAEQAQPDLGSVEPPAASPPRWTVIDRFEKDGHRYIVAVERHGPEQLSASELEVVRLAASRVTNKEIAYRLGLAHATVRVLIHRAARKLGVTTRAKLIEAFRDTKAPRAGRSPRS
ncbi:MAG TPA: helix-turn-helix transcriptional regulator [Polyangiaceae bacterium]|nr:helix-turn-helix transcriptional regulator [Polyangiaceae bacterium]